MRFEACAIKDQTLILSYSYGANQVVSTTIDNTNEAVVVSLRVKRGSGDNIAIALPGEARFALSGDPSTVQYSDGEELDCKRS